MAVRFLPDVHIERAAEALLVEYGRKFGEVAAPPVPVEEILECHFDLSLGFDDLRGRFGDPGVLGATWIEDREVLIDQGLDPAENLRLEGRYRFTVAHETGHWVLHRHQLTETRRTPLIDGRAEPSIICRASAAKKPIEWQADCFAAYLLMPAAMIRQCWADVAGSPDAYVAEEEMRELASQYGLGEDEQPTVDVARRMAGVFNVSGQAMQIRLIKMGFMLTKQPPASLFS